MRGSRAPRSFALSRAPELAGLQASFGALLGGDTAALGQSYRTTASGSREDWTLVLAPRDPALAATLRDITLRGRGAELRCIETRPIDGELQRTLLAGAARSAGVGADAATLASRRPARAGTQDAARSPLALLWLAALALAGWVVGQQLTLSGDLRRFMPEPRTPAQKLLIDELGDGPGTRLLLLSLSGDDPEALAAQSQALVATLAANDDFEFVANGGDANLDAIPESLRAYRYLLTPGFEAQPLDAAYLAGQLDERLQDLGSPVAAMIEPLFPSDPT